jgi:predicted MPP superfamily phosphohydrolase
MWSQLTQAGIHVLENSSIQVRMTSGKNFWISGLADDSTRKPDLLKTLSMVTTDEPVLMLSHDPATFITMNDRPVITLSGHTHGGQMAFPFIGPVIIPGRAPLKYAYGHIKENNRDLIVTSGVGTSVLPIRAFAVPELLEINIQTV